jgi:DNA-binding transcriptional ArsR family regulator
MKRVSQRRVRPVLSSQRLLRLFRFLRLLEHSPCKREQLIKRLQLDIRGFYRDLETLRELGITIEIDKDHRYKLVSTLEEALKLLPYPDPQLTFGEMAELLLHNNTTVLEKLRQQWQNLVGEKIDKTL